MPKNKRPKNYPQSGTWLEVLAEDGSWQAAASTGHMMDGLLHVLLPSNLHFKPFQHPSSVRYASAQSPSIAYVGNPLMSSLLKRQDKEMKHTYTHVKQGRDDAGNPSGIWDACVKSSTIPKALGYVGSSDNQFVAACLGDDAVKKLMAAGMPGQNYINFDDALRAEGLAHLGNPQVPEPVIHPELLNRVWQPAQRPPTLQPISVLERSVFQHPPQAPVSSHKRVCPSATNLPQHQFGMASQQQDGGHQRSAPPGYGHQQQQQLHQERLRLAAPLTADPHAKPAGAGPSAIQPQPTSAPSIKLEQTATDGAAL